MWLQYSEFVIGSLHTGQLAKPHLWCPLKFGCIAKLQLAQISKALGDTLPPISTYRRLFSVVYLANAGLAIVFQLCDHVHVTDNSIVRHLVAYPASRYPRLVAVI